MKTHLLRFTLYSILVFLPGFTLNSVVNASQSLGEDGGHFCGFDDWQPDNRRYARAFAPNLNVGEPRTVRMIYFLPNDRPYRADVVQRMKDEILSIQTFFGEQMDAHGYGHTTFQVETDSRDEPIVHQVDGQHPDSHYHDNTSGTVLDEISLAFNLEANIFLIVFDYSRIGFDVGRSHPAAGLGSRGGKNGGFAFVPGEFESRVAVHELGHAFGLGHDFRDRAYIMSYGPGQDRLSPCSAEFLSVHPYFNLNTPIEKGEPPTIKLISPPTYPAGSQSVPIRLKVNDSEGLHQLLLFVNGGVADVGLEVKACRRLAGDRDFVVEFDYDGVIPSDGLTSLSVPAIHPIFVEVVDIDGNSGNVSFSLTVEPSMEDRRDAEVEVDIPDPNLRAAIAEEIGLPPNTPILRGHLENLTFLDARNANISDLTGLETATNLRLLDLGSKYVEGENRPLNSNSVSDISPLSGLTYLGWLYLGDNSISDISAVAGLTNLKRLNLGNNNISDISSVSGLTNLISLTLVNNLISDISAIAGLTNLIWLNLELNSISDISAVAGLTNLNTLVFYGNSVSDISAVAGLTNLTTLQFWDNLISDISAVAGLTNLKTLSLPNNSVSDISAVVGLTNLTRLNLGNNSVSDISPLVENTGLAGGDHVDLWGNPLNYPSIYKHIPALQERGVEVVFYNRTPQRIRTVSDDNQKGLPSAVLEQPLVVEVQDERGVAFEGVPVTFTVTSGGGTLSATSATTDSNGRAESTLTLGPNPGTNTVEATVTGIAEKRTFNAEGIRIPKTLEIISGVDQAGLLGDVLEKAFVVEVRDQTDKPLPGVEVTFSVSSGDGTLSATSATTDSNGRAESTLTLGPEPGTNTVEATVTGIEEKRTFNADGIRIPKTLEIISGVDQAGLPGEALEKAFVVEVRDQTDKPLPGVEVTFTVTAGGGTVQPEIATTDENGRAESTLTLGPEPGTNTVEATVTGIEEKRTFTAEGSRIPKTLEIISGVDQAGLPGDALEKAFVVEVRDQTDKPLPGVEVTFSVSSGDGTLSATSATTDSNGRAESTLTLGPNLGKNSVRVSVEGISQPESFTAVGIRPEFDLSLPAGISLIHIPIRVTAVDDAPLTIESMSGLYDALGGAEKVNFLVTRDAQRWRIYFGSQNKGTSGDQALTDDLGIIAAMKDAVTIRLAGDSLGRNGNSTITLHRGTNLVGVPLRDSRIMRVSDLLSLEGIRGNVPSIFVSAQGKFVEVRRAADDGNISITGGQSFILTAQRAARVAISGNGWYNTSGTTAAPSVAVTGIEAGDVTPVLALRGSIVDEVRVWSERGRDAVPTESGFRVTVKNLSTGKAVTAVTGDEHLSLPDKVKLIGVGYQLAVVDMESGRAARVGDVLEVSTETSNPLIRVRSLRYTVTAADVRTSRILLPELVTYEIPTETALLPNYPNPFNPETWIPYQLAEDADVTLTIYDTKGVTVRRLDLGHQLAGYYADRGKAAYWDGRNNQGESVASGLYFYQLGTPSFHQIRRMVIIK